MIVRVYGWVLAVRTSEPEPQSQPSLQQKFALLELLQEYTGLPLPVMVSIHWVRQPALCSHEASQLT